MFINSIKEDMKVWKSASNGQLSIKISYTHLSCTYQAITRGSIIWNSSTPPSKSLWVWRLIYGKLPTDYNLGLRGLQFPYYCSICLSNEKTMHHLFFNCGNAKNSWHWLASKLDKGPLISCFEDCLKV